jgi:hypothetical protein
VQVIYGPANALVIKILIGGGVAALLASAVCLGAGPHGHQATAQVVALTGISMRGTLNGWNLA